MLSNAFQWDGVRLKSARFGGDIWTSLLLGPTQVFNHSGRLRMAAVCSTQTDTDHAVGHQ